jgi:hypothetical protein
MGGLSQSRASRTAAIRDSAGSAEGDVRFVSACTMSHEDTKEIENHEE